MERQVVFSGNPYEGIWGHSRAVRVGDHISVSGTAPIPADGSDPPPDAYGQTQLCLQIILKALSKRPEDRFQTGAEFDAAMCRVADQMCPGWQRSLEPGADLSRMVPRPSTTVAPATPIGIAISQPGAAIQAPPHAVYNPTPPVKPVAKKATGCVSVLGVLLALAATAAILAGAALVR